LLAAGGLKVRRCVSRDAGCAMPRTCSRPARIWPSSPLGRASRRASRCCRIPRRDCPGRRHATLEVRDERDPLAFAGRLTAEIAWCCARRAHRSTATLLTPATGTRNHQHGAVGSPVIRFLGRWHDGIELFVRPTHRSSSSWRTSPCRCRGARRGHTGDRHRCRRRRRVVQNE
jgi:hypothetical protein